MLRAHRSSQHRLRTYDVKQDALAAGCNEVLAKPLDLELLLGKIKSTLARLNPGGGNAPATATSH